MKITVETKVLQGMINTAYKGASRNKADVMTNLIDVYCNDGRISLTTTDGSNYLTVFGNAESDEKTHFSILLDKFYKVISKTTTDKLKLTVKDDYLSFTGNGTYKIPFLLDVDGSYVKFPVKKIDNPSKSGEVSRLSICDAVKHNKLSLSMNNDDSKIHLSGYLCTDDAVFTSDEINLCMNSISTISERAIIPPTVFDIIAGAKADVVKYKVGDNCAIFDCGDIRVYCTFIPNIEDFPEAVCRKIMSTEIKSKCTVSRTGVLGAIGRLALFVDERQRNVVRFTFTKDGITLSTVSDDAIETVPYQGITDFEDYTCLVDVDHIKAILSSYDVESIDMYFGNPQILRINNGSVSHAIALRRERK